MSPIDPFVRPGEFFERHPWDRLLGGAAVVVLVLALVGAAGFTAMGWVLADEMTGTSTVDNPEHTPEWVCEQHGDGAFGDGCDEPETIEVDNGELLWEAWTDSGYAGYVFLAMLFGWPLAAAALHATSRFAGGEGSFGRTLAVAGWGMAPLVFEVLLSVGLWWYQVRTAELASDPEVLIRQIEGIEPLVGGAVLTVAVGLWQWYVWAHGLERARGLSREAAAAAAGAVAAVWILFGLV
jgi:hypothetical protein